MRASRIFRFAIPALLAVVVSACKDSDTTTAPGSLANVTMNAPGTVTSGQSFTIDLAATAVGVNNVQNGQVSVTLPSPLTVSSVDASSGTSATFTSGPGATVTWTLGVLDANTQSTLHVHVAGTLPPGSSAQTLTLQAMLTGTGIAAGDATAQASVQLMP
jgi:hypothetical protein